MIQKDKFSTIQNEFTVSFFLILVFNSFFVISNICIFNQYPLSLIMTFIFLSIIEFKNKVEKYYEAKINLFDILERTPTQILRQTRVFGNFVLPNLKQTKIQFLIIYNFSYIMSLTNVMRYVAVVIV